MAEPKKGTSSFDPKDKDDEIGKEFLSSWKSMSVTEDDAMDFGFDTVPNGKKKNFNFEKLDMDFNLDGDFDKFSSFKMDMPDLDFSCSPKKTAKPKERSEEESSGNNQGKQNPFNFSFDFNELDGFDFDSSLMKKGEKTSSKNLDGKGVTSDRNEDQGPKLLQAEVIDNNIITKLAAPESMANSKLEKLVGVPEACNSINDTSLLNPATLASTYPGKRKATITEEMDQQSPLTENVLSTESHTLQMTHNLPVQTVCDDDSNRDTILDIHTKVCSLGSKVNSSSGAGQNVNTKIIAVVGSNHENMPPKNSSLLHIMESEKSKCEQKESGGNSPTEIMDETESTQGDIDLEDTSTAGLSGKTPQDTCANQDIQSLTSKLPLVLLGSEQAVNNLTPTKEKETGAIHSIFRKSEETGPQVLQSSSAQPQVFFGNKKIGSTHLCPPNENRANDTQLGSELVGNSNSFSQELSKGELVLLGSQKNVTNPSDTSEQAVNNLTPAEEKETGAIPSRFFRRSEETGPQVLHSSAQPQVFSFGDKKIGTTYLCPANENRANDAQLGSKLVGNSNSFSQELSKGKPVLLGNQKNVTIRSDTSSRANHSCPTEKPTKLLVSSMESMGNSKILSVDRLKTGKRMPDLSSLKNLRTVSAKSANKDPTSSTLPRETNSMRNLEQNLEVPGNTISRIAHPVGRTERQTPPTPSLKRKNSVELNADLASLKLLKRLSVSPRGSRSFKESSERVVEEKISYQQSILVCNQENRTVIKTKNIRDHPTSPVEAPHEVNMTNLEMPLVMESDGNVEKAEAYTKELEDICNMLKKKHEEAKEILVRAIVNNNNLLMLNHPIYEENIRMVEKFAAMLISKELPM